MMNVNVRSFFQHANEEKMRDICAVRARMAPHTHNVNGDLRI